MIDSLALTTFFLLPDKPDTGFAWYDIDGKETSDVKKVAHKEKIQIPRQRIASGSEDFQVVYHREFAKTELDDNDDNHKLFIKELKTHIELLIEKHSSKREYEF